MSLMWMPAQTTRPPLRTAFSAIGTSSPTVPHCRFVLIDSENLDPPLSLGDEAEHRTQQHGFAAPGRANQAEDLTGPNIQ